MGNQIKKVGIIGAGQMGGGIAHVCALAGYDVGLSRRLQGSHRVRPCHHQRQHRPAGRLRKSHRNPNASSACRISASPTFEPRSDADLVIESAVEDEEVKRKIFSSSARILKEAAILATNTSSISITRLAATTDRPERSSAFTS
jgi:3-hydroxybutyryl-CoA dehydrogenase